MRRSILYAAALLGLASTAGAQSIVDGVAVEGVKMERNGQYLAVDMDMDGAVSKCAQSLYYVTKHIK